MAFACALFAACSPQQPFVTSPDGRIAVSVEADAEAGVTYAVTVDDKPLILPSAMGLAACGTSLQGATITGVWHSSHDKLWTAPWGENKRHRNRYNEMSVAVRKSDKSIYFFGSPLFDKAEVRVRDGVLTVTAHNNSAANKYIQAVKLNGKPYTKPYIAFDDIAAGGVLEFEMGAEPAVWYEL